MLWHTPFAFANQFVIALDLYILFLSRCMLFQEDDSCSNNAAISETMDEEYSFNEIQTEPNELGEEHLLTTTDSPIDIPNDVVFKPEPNLSSDAIEELLIEGLQCEFVSMLGKQKSHLKPAKLIFTYFHRKITNIL